MEKIPIQISGKMPSSIFWSLNNGIMIRMKPIRQMPVETNLQDLNLTVELRGITHLIKNFEKSIDICLVDVVEQIRIYETYDQSMVIIALYLNINVDMDGAPSWKRIFVYQPLDKKLTEIWSGDLNSDLKCFISQKYIQITASVDYIQPSYSLFEIHNRDLKFMHKGQWQDLQMYAVTKAYLNYIFKPKDSLVPMYLIDDVLVVNHELYLDFVHQKAWLFDNNDYHLVLDQLFKQSGNYISSLPKDVVDLIKTWIPIDHKKYSIEPIQPLPSLVETKRRPPIAVESKRRPYTALKKYEYGYIESIETPEAACVGMLKFLKK